MKAKWLPKCIAVIIIITIAGVLVAIYVGFYQGNSQELEIEALNDEDPILRERAIYELIKEPPLDAFKRQLMYVVRSDKNSSVRIAALRALPYANLSEREARKILSRALRDKDPDVRAVTIDVLGSLLHDMSALHSYVLSGLRDIDARVRWRATATLLLHMDIPDFIIAANDALRDEDPRVQFEGAYTLAAASKASKESTSILVDSLKNPSYGWRSIFGLRLSGKLAIDAVPALMEIVNDIPSHPTTEEILDKSHPDDDVLDLLRNGKPGSRVLAELETYGSDSVRAIRGDDQHISVLSHHWENGWQEINIGPISDNAYRVCAIEALRHISPTPATVQVMIDLLNDEFSDVRKEATNSLGQLSLHVPEQIDRIITQLIYLLKNDKHGKVRSEASKALGVLGLQAPQAMPVMISALGDEDEDVRHYAEWYLTQFGSDAARAVPDLQKLLPGADVDEKRRILEAFEAIGTAAAPAVPEIINEFCHPNSVVRQAAFIAIEGIGPEAKGAIPALIAVLRDEESSDRPYAVRALGSIGTDAIDSLLNILDDDVDSTTRRYISEVLDIIGFQDPKV